MTIDTSPTHSSATIEYKTKCCKCENVATEKFSFHPDMQVPKPYLPAHWTRISNRFYCPKHSIDLHIDGEFVLTFPWDA